MYNLCALLDLEARTLTWKRRHVVVREIAERSVASHIGRVVRIPKDDGALQDIAKLQAKHTAADLTAEAVGLLVDNEKSGVVNGLAELQVVQRISGNRQIIDNLAVAN